jgi:hypothetical protein
MNLDSVINKITCGEKGGRKSFTYPDTIARTINLKKNENSAPMLSYSLENFRRKMYEGVVVGNVLYFTCCWRSFSTKT